MPEDADELAGLERRREELYRELGQVGDFRRGSLNEVRRKCGKPGCACAAPDHPGHGPQWNLTRKVEGRTRAVHLKPGPELEKARREVAEYERFRGLVGQVTEVNEAICQARPAAPGRPAMTPLPGREGKKGAPGGARAGEGRRDRTAGRRGGQGPGLRRRRAGGRGGGDPGRAAAAGRERARSSCWPPTAGTAARASRAAGGTRRSSLPTGTRSSTRCSARSP